MEGEGSVQGGGGLKCCILGGSGKGFQQGVKGKQMRKPERDTGGGAPKQGHVGEHKNTAQGTQGDRDSGKQGQRQETGTLIGMKRDGTLGDRARGVGDSNGDMDRHETRRDFGGPGTGRGGIASTRDYF